MNPGQQIQPAPHGAVPCPCVTAGDNGRPRCPVQPAQPVPGHGHPNHRRRAPPPATVTAPRPVPPQQASVSRGPEAVPVPC